MADHRCDIDDRPIAKSYIYIKARTRWLAPMRYGDSILAVGLAHAESNGPDLFLATIIAPRPFFMKFYVYEAFLLYKGKGAVFTYFNSAPVHALGKSKADHPRPIFHRFCPVRFQMQHFLP